MDNKTKTINLQGKEYAQVKDRILEFRQANPRGLIDTKPEIQPDGQIMFRARVLKDKSDETSAEATGHALGANKGLKAFEKLETIAVGRALALLGYASDGEIASGEEMEEFENYRDEKKAEVVFELTEKIRDVKTLKELADVWASIDGSFKKDMEAIKNNRKAELQNEDN